MKYADFFKLASRCRKAQRAYFATRTHTNLVIARDVERELDQAIRSIEAMRPAEQPRQQELFKTGGQS